MVNGNAFPQVTAKRVTLLHTRICGNLSSGVSVPFDFHPRFFYPFKEKLLPGRKLRNLWLNEKSPAFVTRHAILFC